jgi:hypothetical protein
MSDIEPVIGHEIEPAERTILDELAEIEQVGLLHIKGYSIHEISSLVNTPIERTKNMIAEYKKILNRQAELDPYFLEKIQFNTIKALQEFDQLSKEAWETINIATDHGMVPARIQAIKLAAEVATKKAQLHKLMGGNQADAQYISRMQKAENVNQILSKILRDVISKHPQIAEEVRRELEIALEIMDVESSD